MRYLIILVVFAMGYFLGGWQKSSTQIVHSKQQGNQVANSRYNGGAKKTSNPEDSCNNVATRNDADTIVKPTQRKGFKQVAANSIDSAKRNKKINDLYKQLQSARESDDISGQLSLIEEMESIDHKNKIVYEAKTFFFRDQGDYANVRKTLIECVEAHPNFLSCHRQLGNVRTATDEEKDIHTKKCLEIQPDHGGCLIDRAHFFFKEGRFPEAITLYEKIINENLYENRQREKKHIYFFYAQALEFNNQYESAMEIYQQACDLNHKKSCKMLSKFSRQTS